MLQLYFNQKKTLFRILFVFFNRVKLFLRKHFSLLIRYLQKIRLKKIDRFLNFQSRI